ncbi:VCBS repeat-containing protein [Fulvivirgaceae bacterium BMA12]|uniref:VCBS repeat-containing protein n=1 Tax=Agaribacillus aureus TaxID=3051825 RepID=A0ABT8L915_9BACT|nr:VCBS repeat-containing protein [Fulvivirgaceae bacterium BMA12]
MWTPLTTWSDIAKLNLSIFYAFIFFIPAIFFPSQTLAQDQPKLFTLLNSRQTNINFENTVSDEREHNIFLYENYYSGGGVGIGDFNRDGLADIYFTGNLVGDRLYINQGEMQFKDITTSAGIKDNGAWSSGVAVADVNGDGWDDIYVCNEMYDNAPELRKNKLYINNGDLTFTESAEKYGVADAERSRQAIFFDYDGDRDIDLFLLNSPPEPGKYSGKSWDNLMIEKYSPRLYQNTGEGFIDVSQKAGVLKAGFPNSASSGDFNGDGWPDLYVANDFRAPDFLYLNNGDGTFTNVIDQAARHISNFSMGVDVGDINNDGLLDIFVLDMAAEDNYRSKANMSGMNPQAFWQVVNEGGHFQYMFNTLQLNQGDNHFSDIAQLSGVSSTDWSWSNLIVDLDNDGHKDIFVTNGIMREIRNTDAFLRIPAYVKAVANDFRRKNPGVSGLNIWDVVNLDSVLALLPSQKLSNYAFKNEGDLTFTKKSKDWGLDQQTFSNGSAFADLDNDGDLDLIVNNTNDPAFIYRNNAEKLTANNFLRIKLVDDNRSVIGTKLAIEHQANRQFFEVTNARGMFSNSEQIAHFGLGKDNKVDKIIITWPDQSVTIKNNIKANQLISINKKSRSSSGSAVAQKKQRLFQNYTHKAGIKFSHRENEFDDFAKQILLPHKMSQFGPGLAVADVDGNGLDDVFVGGAAGFVGALYLQYPDRKFIKMAQAPWENDKACEDVDALFFDVDGDGDQDLYVVSGGNEFVPGDGRYQDRLYINTGKIFEKSEGILPVITESGSKVIPGDYDSDGDIDLFLGGRLTPHSYPMPGSSHLLNNNNGKFRDVTAEVAAELTGIGMVTDAVWTDFDVDGRQDLIVVGEWMPISFFKNVNGSFQNVTDDLGFKEMTGWWFDIAKGDFDGDGDDDYIVGNLGTNSKYKASEDEPFQVHYDDFDHNGSKDIVLSYYNFGNLYPVRGKSCSSQQIPQLRKKFKTYDLFASSDLNSIYGAENLDKALHYSAKTFASVFIENLGGKFKLSKLPNEAQLSTINDVVIDDFDSDGNLDALLAGNFYGSEVETPRNDASVGLLMRGDGKNNFEAVSPAKSGFYAPYDVKNMEVMHAGKDKMVLLGINNDDLQIFKVLKIKNL